MKSIWTERIETGLETSALKLLAHLYCEILHKGKDSGEYTDWEESVLKRISAEIEDKAGGNIIAVLDVAVLEGRKLPITHKSRFTK